MGGQFYFKLESVRNLQNATLVEKFDRKPEHASQRDRRETATCHAKSKHARHQQTFHDGAVQKRQRDVHRIQLHDFKSLLSFVKADRGCVDQSDKIGDF